MLSQTQEQDYSRRQQDCPQDRHPNIRRHLRLLSNVSFSEGSSSGAVVDEVVNDEYDSYRTAETADQMVSSEEHTHAEARELFFDLIFVAVALELGGLFEREVAWSNVGLTFEIFVTIWLTWLHSNMLLTRFDVPGVWKLPFFGVMLGTMLLGTVVVYGQLSEDHIPAIFSYLAMTRGVMLFFYVAIYYQIPRARHVVRIYVVVFAISTAFGIVVASLAEGSVGRVLWPISIVLELGMYPLSIYGVAPANQLAINVEHNIERNQLWVILILGETVIQLINVKPSTGILTWEFYLCATLSFSITFVLLLLYLYSQPMHRIGMDTHALDCSASRGFLWMFCVLMETSGLFAMGAGTKYIITHCNDDGYETNHGILYTGGIAWALLWHNVSRSTHEWGHSGILGTDNCERSGRLWISVLSIGLAMGVAPLGLAVGYETADTDNTSGNPYGTPGLIKPVELQAIVLGWVFVMLVLDLLLRPGDRAWEDLEDAKAEQIQEAWAEEQPAVATAAATSSTNSTSCANASGGGDGGSHNGADMWGRLRSSVVPRQSRVDINLAMLQRIIREQHSVRMIGGNTSGANGGAVSRDAHAAPLTRFSSRESRNAREHRRIERLGSNGGRARKRSVWNSFKKTMGIGASDGLSIAGAQNSSPAGSRRRGSVAPAPPAALP